MRDGTGQTTSEDRATQLLIWETLSLAMSEVSKVTLCPYSHSQSARVGTDNVHWTLEKQIYEYDWLKVAHTYTHTLKFVLLRYKHFTEPLNFTTRNFQAMTDATIFKDLGSVELGYYCEGSFALLLCFHKINFDKHWHQTSFGTLDKYSGRLKGGIFAEKTLLR